MGRSENTGPKVSVLRLNTPSAGSKVYVNPAEDDPSGKLEICDAIPRFNWVSRAWGLDCEAKCAAWLLGGGESRRITGLLVEKNCRSGRARPSSLCAVAPEGAMADTSVTRTRAARRADGMARSPAYEPSRAREKERQN